MPSVCRLLPYLVSAGPSHMAADETLLHSAVAGQASLRFYGWSMPTLSLGYFQSAGLPEADEQLRALPLVRRPSGGAALVHHHELTYALALPAGPPWQGGQSWLCRMHRIIQEALGELGVATTSCGAEEAAPFSGILCFQYRTSGDLRIGAAKIVGSAQRRQRGALLQHGAILLAASPVTPALPGIRELSGLDLPAARVEDAVRHALQRQTGWELKEADWEDAERRQWNKLAADKYAAAHWNQKR